MTEIEDNNLSAAVLGKKAIVEFRTKTCPACTKLEATMSKVLIKNGGDVNVFRCCVENNMDLARKYQVMSVPTIILFRDGKPFRQMVGASSEMKIQELLDD